MDESDPGRGAAYAHCSFRFESVFKGETKPFVAVGRNTFTLRRKDGAWKFIHYHESRPGEL